MILAGRAAFRVFLGVELLRRASVPDRRLRDARHTAVTVLLLLGLPARTVMGSWAARTPRWPLATSTSLPPSGATSRSASAVCGGDRIRTRDRIGRGRDRRRERRTATISAAAAGTWSSYPGVGAGQSCGSGGIRTPGRLPVSRFQGECIRPLCHASVDQRSRRSTHVAWWSEASFRRARGSAATGQNTPLPRASSGRDGST